MSKRRTLFALLPLFGLLHAAQLDASLRRKKGDDPFLLRSEYPKTEVHTVELDYSNAPPLSPVDQTIARPPTVNGDPYSEPVWVDSSSMAQGASASSSSSNAGSSSASSASGTASANETSASSGSSASAANETSASDASASEQSSGASSASGTASANETSASSGSPAETNETG
eukprot:s2042_g17.t1